MRGHDHRAPRTLTPNEAADIAGELSDDDLAGGRLESLCVTSAADEAATLSEASLRLREFAEWLLELELDGWQLTGPVDGGHGPMVNEDPEKRAYDRT